MTDDFDAGSVVDEATGLPNALGWQSLLEMEERRCERYGGNPAVLLVDVKGPTTSCLPEAFDEGDLARLVADAVASTSRETDAVARVGDRRFAVLATESGGSARILEGRLRLALQIAGVTATVQSRSRRSWAGLEEAWRQLQAAASAAEWIGSEFRGAGNFSMN